VVEGGEGEGRGRKGEKRTMSFTMQHCIFALHYPLNFYFRGEKEKEGGGEKGGGRRRMAER